LRPIHLSQRMFTRYWRNYPWFLQLILFMLMVFIFMSFSTYLVLVLVPKIMGVKIADIAGLSGHSSFQVIRATLVAVAISHAGRFAIPALLFAVFVHPGAREYLGLRAPGKAIHWVLVTGIMLGLIPLLLFGENWTIQHLHFGKWADDMQQTGSSQVNAFLKLSSGPDLISLLAVLALLPAFGEELVFRGVLLRLFHRKIVSSLPLLEINGKQIQPDTQRTMVLPVIGTALIFALIHFNPYGFVYIFIAGCVLALIYFLTGSILCSMWGHFLYNGTQILTIFLMEKSKSGSATAVNENLPIWLPFIGLIIFATSFYLLVSQQTPLPGNWSNDFSKEESQQMLDESTNF